MKTVALTGASGFVGANLARRLLRDGHDVHLLLRPQHTSWRLKSMTDEVRLHVVNMEDGESLRDVMRTIRADWIFHLAAHGAYPAQTDADAMIRTNIVSTLNLINSALGPGFESFVHAGSSSEYGWKDHAPAEDEWIDPNSYYAVTKASATMLCRHIARSQDVHICTLRLYSVYGPYEEPARLVPRLIVCGLKGELPPLVSPHTARDYVYSSDVDEAFVCAATAPTGERGAIYNIGTGVQTSLSDVVETARKVFNISVEPQWDSMSGRSWDTDVWIADPQKSTTQLGWQPLYTFEDGFRETTEWYRSRPEIHPLYEQGS
ncbi:MAG: GDP-mannose 4,6-dehydratase [Chloroflexota bacterium]